MHMATSSWISQQSLCVDALVALTWDFTYDSYDKSKNAMTQLYIPVATLAKLDSIQEHWAQERDFPS